MNAALGFRFVLAFLAFLSPSSWWPSSASVMWETETRRRRTVRAARVQSKGLPPRMQEGKWLFSLWEWGAEGVLSL